MNLKKIGYTREKKKNTTPAILQTAVLINQGQAIHRSEELINKETVNQTKRQTYNKNKYKARKNGKVIDRVSEWA